MTDLSNSSSRGSERIAAIQDVVVCAECHRELNSQAPTLRPMPVGQADAVAVGWLLLVLRQFTYTPWQAEHLMVMLRGQTRAE